MEEPVTLSTLTVSSDHEVLQQRHLSTATRNSDQRSLLTAWKSNIGGWNRYQKTNANIILFHCNLALVDIGSYLLIDTNKVANCCHFWNYPFLFLAQHIIVCGNAGSLPIGLAVPMAYFDLDDSLQ
ncbi:hypothetical protein FVEG_15807 [Fusarium verticillioides 7600]|uniref:Uncharacterized protein n=1 Tax=Gibberella moniliformis (strain M3125 / FGSC 7600) TaxID=334819 RepID=W7MKK2_GIBM7|nr:hypothetical protein FVEG_15807 [Fusarium verticillioides 7600]XP_018751408.1 hypothetical protein FVEG_15807 [Fusarium verticillioides 7600]EWG45216.1 hypothetical protein FVEG_15807 [Fusarium verticillioides 7600]EWG45217.1 hypothetical protein FVEG_15807 [Fusarium verticillioides 7600]